MIVKVTQEHIDRSKKHIQEYREKGLVGHKEYNYCENCPVALAIKDIKLITIGCFVSLTSVNFDSGVRVKFSKTVINKIIHFDKTMEMKPFEFKLNI